MASLLKAVCIASTLMLVPGLAQSVKDVIVTNRACSKDKSLLASLVLVAASLFAPAASALTVNLVEFGSQSTELMSSASAFLCCGGL